MAKRAIKRVGRDSVFRTAAGGGDPGVFQCKPTVRKSRPYKPHCFTPAEIQLSVFQEFIIYMVFLRRGLDKDILAKLFLGATTKPALRVIKSVLRTWVAGLDGILKAEEWWLKPEHKDRAKSRAFSGEFGEEVLAVADCTNVNCEGSTLSELINQQLYSTYYKHTCGKYAVACSRVGGCIACAPGQGGPAGDHQCMVQAGLFDPDKWKVEDGKPWPQMLYDAGVTARTKTAAQQAGCDLVTSGIVRKSKSNTLSFAQRSTNFRVSSLRIRVENFIGIIKRHFKILRTVIPLSDIGMMDKIVYACFMLHNFGSLIIE